MPKLATIASTMNVSIGQGALLTTPLQMVRAYAAIANGGTLVHPHILLKITDPQGKTVQTFQPKNKQKLSLSPDVINILRTSLQDVVTRGTAKDKGLISIRSPVKQALRRQDVTRTIMPGLLVMLPMTNRNTVLLSLWNTHRDMVVTLQGLLPESLCHICFLKSIMLREDTGKMKLFWTHMGTFSFLI